VLDGVIPLLLYGKTLAGHKTFELRAANYQPLALPFHRLLIPLVEPANTGAKTLKAETCS
jgi:hypothetical protein